MDLRQLRYFVKVVECGNVTRASELLHIAQPAISQQILNLESELNILLLKRNTHGVTPTAAGKTLYQHAIALLREADRTRDLLRLDADFPQGKVSVGFPSSSSWMFAIPLTRIVLERYPGITLELIDVPTADMQRLIESGRIDLAIMADIAETPCLGRKVLFSEDLCLIVWPEYELPQVPIQIRDLARMPLILPAAPNSIRSRVEQALRDEGLPCVVLVEASSVHLILAAVQAKLGVTVLPWSATHPEPREFKLKSVRINHPHFRRTISLCWRNNALLSNAIVKIRDTILDLLITLRQTGSFECSK